MPVLNSNHRFIKLQPLFIGGDFILEKRGGLIAHLFFLIEGCLCGYRTK